MSETDLTALSDDDLDARLDDRSLSEDAREQADNELDRRDAARRAAQPASKAFGPELMRRINAAGPDAEEARAELDRRKAERDARAVKEKAREQAEIAAMTDEGLRDRLARGGYSWAFGQALRDEFARRGLPEKTPSVQQEQPEAPEQKPSPLEGHQGEVQIIKPAEPNKTRPIWVLYDQGGFRGRRGARKLVMREWEWSPLAQTFWPTDTPDQYVSLYKAIEAADWIGRLPKQGRRRTVTTRENLERIRPLAAEGKTDRQIADILRRRGHPIGYRSVGNMRKTYL